MSGIYLVLLNVTRVPPHLAIAIDGKLYTLSVKGPAVEGEFGSLLRTVRQRSIESIFIRLAVPAEYTAAQLTEEMKKCVLAYPRVDVGLATCLAPIKDFCHSVFNIDTKKIHFIYELLPALSVINALAACHHLNLDEHLQENNFFLKKYSMDDINEEIKRASLILAV